MSNQISRRIIELAEEFPGITRKQIIERIPEVHYQTVNNHLKKLKIGGYISNKGHSLYYTGKVWVSEEIRMAFKPANMFSLVNDEPELQDRWKYIISVCRFIAEMPPETKMPQLEMTVAEYKEMLIKIFNERALEVKLLDLMLLSQFILNPSYFTQFISVDDQPKESYYIGIVDLLKNSPM